MGLVAPATPDTTGPRKRRRGPPKPSLRRERAFWASGATRVVGVDEVGVAPTCGAVVAAAVIMPSEGRRIPGVRDSKTLSTAQRERLFPFIRRRAVALGVGAASVAEIDRLNIYHATHLAMRRAIARVGEHDHVLVDGLRIAGFEQEVGPYTAIVDGDALCYSIACASIIAKVIRDRMMVKLAARYPWYGWEHNAGYATREHRAAILEHGLTPFHRRSFHALDILLAGEQQTLDFYLNGELDTELQPEVDTGHHAELDTEHHAELDSEQHPERDTDLPGELDSELEMIGA